MVAPSEGAGLSSRAGGPDHFTSDLVRRFEPHDGEIIGVLQVEPQFRRGLEDAAILGECENSHDGRAGLRARLSCRD